MKNKFSHSLQNEWVINEYMVTKSAKYDGCNRSLLSFNTIEGFWQAYCHLPKPSEVFYVTNHQGQSLTFGNERMTGYSMFKKGITPEWEHPANASGGRIFFKRSLDARTADLTWENILLGLIGEMMDDENQYINGVRITDKGIAARSSFKVEIWIRTAEREVVEKLKPIIAECICDNNERLGGGGRRDVRGLELKFEGFMGKQEGRGDWDGSRREDDA